MVKPGPARKVTLYLGEDVKYRAEPLYVAVLNYLFYHGVSGATVTRGIAGFGAGHRMHTAQILELSGNLPIRIEFVEDPARLESILPKLVDMVAPALVDVQETTVVSAGSGAEERQAAPSVRRAELKGRATLMRIFVGEDDRWGGRPLYDAIVESLRAHDIAGVTVYRGVAGYGAHRRFHTEKRLGLSRDQPIVLSVVDEERKIRAYLPLLEQMMQEGLVVLSDVDVITYAHRLEPADPERAS